MAAKDGKSVISLSDLIGKLERIASQEIPEAKRAALSVSGKIVQEKARSLFGHYHTNPEPFGEWPQLAESTQSQRKSQGWSANDPLFRSGELRETIHHEEVSDNVEVIGSPDLIMHYQEFGTDKIPPRPVLGPAALSTGEAVTETVGIAIYEAIASKKTGRWANRGIEE